MKIIKFSSCMLIAVFLCDYLIFQSSARAEESLEDTIDCTEVSIDYTDDPNLTREERLRRLDAAFYESLNRFELCQEAKEQAKAEAAANDGGAAGNGAGGGVGENETSSTGESMASSTMSGTEKPSEEKPFSAAEGFEATEKRPLESNEDIEEAGSNKTESIAKGNGRTPEDIPPAANDDTLAAQIRFAAENEPDPEKRRQLWNEYRKYKGIKTR